MIVRFKENVDSDYYYKEKKEETIIINYLK